MTPEQLVLARQIVLAGWLPTHGWASYDPAKKRRWRCGYDNDHSWRDVNCVRATNAHYGGRRGEGGHGVASLLRSVPDLTDALTLGAMRLQMPAPYRPWQLQFGQWRCGPEKNGIFICLQLTEEDAIPHAYLAWLLASNPVKEGHPEAAHGDNTAP